MEAIPEELRAVLSDIPAPKRQQAIQVLMAMAVRSGPLPSPEDFARYGEVLSDAPDRILRMAERQSEHRMELEKTVIRRQLNQSGIGQVFALLISAGGLGMCGWLAINYHDWVAGIVGGTTVVGLVSAFLYGKKRQREDLDSKQPKG